MFPGIASLTLLLAAVTLPSTPAQADPWDWYNDPAIMDSNYVYNYNRLPKSGRAPDPLPWSETYWPAKKGSINIRWNTDDQDGFNYTPPSREEVRRMSKAELAQLSPSEKYDIYRGRYDYPIWHEVANSWANASESDWAGICDGWSTAAVQYREPQAVEARNPDGIVVPFGSSDIKALLAWNAAARFQVDTRQVGTRCWKRIFSSGGCDDINAGAMHVILTNQLGIRRQPFVMDRDPGPEIWNQPVFGYETEEVGSASSSRFANAVQMHTTIYYTDELETSQWRPVTGTSAFQVGKLNMDYVLELDENNNIVGGYYLRGSDFPDFMWKPINKMTFTGDMAAVNQLYKPVR